MLLALGTFRSKFATDAYLLFIAAERVHGDCYRELLVVRYWSKSGKHLLVASISPFDPDVWSGRALQEVFVEVAVAVLHQCIRSLIGAGLLRTIMDISARAISLTDRPQRAIWVTSVRMRREDRSSISSHPLADLGR
jgi:hypothetical protein